MLPNGRLSSNFANSFGALACPEDGGDPLVPAEVYAGGRTIQIPRWQEWARAAHAKLEKLLEEAA